MSPRWITTSGFSAATAFEQRLRPRLSRPPVADQRHPGIGGQTGRSARSRRGPATSGTAARRADRTGSGAGRPGAFRPSADRRSRTAAAQPRPRRWPPRRHPPGRAPGRDRRGRSDRGSSPARRASENAARCTVPAGDAPASVVAARAAATMTGAAWSTGAGTAPAGVPRALTHVDARQDGLEDRDGGVGEVFEMRVLGFGCHVRCSSSISAERRPDADVAARSGHPSPRLILLRTAFVIDDRPTP